MDLSAGSDCSRVILCPVRLVQVNTVLDYKLCRDDLPGVLQGAENVASAWFLMVCPRNAVSDFGSNVCSSVVHSAAASPQSRCSSKVIKFESI